jgi:hypothetical protein
MSIECGCYVGETVGVVDHNYRSQGYYVVQKANKMVVELRRKSDGYVRSWSVRTGIEKTSYSSNRYNTASIVSAEKLKAVLLHNQKQTEKHAVWSQMDQAVSNRNIALIKELTEKIVALSQ